MRDMDRRISRMAQARDKHLKELKIMKLCLKKYTKKFGIFEIEIRQRDQRIGELEASLEQRGRSRFGADNGSIGEQSRGLEIHSVGRFGYAGGVEAEDRNQNERFESLRNRIGTVKMAISELKVEKSAYLVEFEKSRQTVDKLKSGLNDIKTQINLLKMVKTNPQRDFEIFHLETEEYRNQIFHRPIHPRIRLNPNNLDYHNEDFHSSNFRNRHPEKSNFYLENSDRGFSKQDFLDDSINTFSQKSVYTDDDNSQKFPFKIYQLPTISFNKSIRGADDRNHISLEIENNIKFCIDRADPVVESRDGSFLDIHELSLYSFMGDGPPAPRRPSRPRRQARLSGIAGNIFHLREHTQRKTDNMHFKIERILGLLAEVRRRVQSHKDADTEAEILRVKEMNFELHTDNTDLSSTVKDLKEDISKLKSENANLLEQNEKLQQSFSEIKDKKKKKLREENLRLRNELDELKMRLDSLHTRRDSPVRNFNKHQFDSLSNLGDLSYARSAASLEEHDDSIVQDSFSEISHYSSQVPDYSGKMWQILEDVTQVSTKSSKLQRNFDKVENLVRKHEQSHRFLLEMKMKYEKDYGNPLKQKFTFKLLMGYIREDVSMKYMLES